MKVWIVSEHLTEDSSLNFARGNLAVFECEESAKKYKADLDRDRAEYSGKFYTLEEFETL